MIVVTRSLSDAALVASQYIIGALAPCALCVLLYSVRIKYVRLSCDASPRSSTRTAASCIRLLAIDAKQA